MNCSTQKIAITKALVSIYKKIKFIFFLLFILFSILLITEFVIANPQMINVNIFNFTHINVSVALFGVIAFSVGLLTGSLYTFIRILPKFITHKHTTKIERDNPNL